MDIDQDESVFSLITKLCEKFTNEPSKLKEYRKKSYEILLGKRLPKRKGGIVTKLIKQITVYNRNK